MPFAKHEQMVQALALYPLNSGFDEGVHVRTSWRERAQLNPLRFEDATELLCELAVAVADEMRGTMLPLLLEEHVRIARLLSHPCPVRVGRHAGNVDLPCALRTRATVDREIERLPDFLNSPRIRVCPQLVSLAIWTINWRISSGLPGRPGLRGLRGDDAPSAQRKIVRGVTMAINSFDDRADT